jgi:hypothetical protein
VGGRWAAKRFGRVLCEARVQTGGVDGAAEACGGQIRKVLGGLDPFHGKALAEFQYSGNHMPGLVQQEPEVGPCPESNVVRSNNGDEEILALRVGNDKEFRRVAELGEDDEIYRMATICASEHLPYEVPGGPQLR